MNSTLHLLLALCLGTSLLVFIVSTITRNYSQVDKLWSLMPMAYAWIIAARSGMEPRIVLMACLVTAWGLRLTWNFGRKGGYSWKFWSGTEDYRWAVLQTKPVFARKWRWVLFNLLFISLYQMALILLFTLPAWQSVGGHPMSWTDGLLAGLFLLFLVLETVADQQQWDYQTRKRELAAAGEAMPDEYRKGFAHKGLWGIVRHPNYASEQAIWIVFYLFSVSATGRWLHWTIAGPILLVLLFKGSSDFSESISMGKYPDYRGYRRQVPRFLPLPVLKGRRD